MRQCTNWLTVFFGILVLTGLPTPAKSQPAGAESAAAAPRSDDQLAKQLTNPLAALISVPFQMTFDRNIGPVDDGYKLTTNVQPVVPFVLNKDWNLISRTILPFIYQERIIPGAGSQLGLGDTVQSFFFSPRKPTSRGIIWGIGPVLLLPTGTEPLLRAQKWGAGPTGVALFQRGPWTAGALANHIWSFAGSSARPDVNTTFVQPFVSHTTSDAWTFAVTSESNYSWTAKAWSIPVNFNISKLVKLGKLPVSIGGGFGYWARSPTGGPKGFRFRAQLTFLLPKR